MRGSRWPLEVIQIAINTLILLYPILFYVILLSVRWRVNFFLLKIQIFVFIYDHFLLLISFGRIRILLIFYYVHLTKLKIVSAIENLICVFLIFIFKLFAVF